MKEFLNNQTLIYLITDGETNENNFPAKSQKTLRLIKTAVEAGVQLIQIREKKLPARLIFQLTVEAVRLTKHTGTKLLINDRADIASAVRADGVHLTSNSIPTKIIRRDFPGDFIIGVSVHSLEKASEAQGAGADFVTYSPIFYSPEKSQPKGLGDLRDICERLSPFPVIALGGIDANNFAETLNTGAKGIAAIRLFSGNKKLSEIIDRIQKFKRENE